MELELQTSDVEANSAKPAVSLEGSKCITAKSGVLISPIGDTQTSGGIHLSMHPAVIRSQDSRLRQKASGSSNTEAQLHAAQYPQAIPQARNPNAFAVSQYAPPHVKSFMAAVLASTQPAAAKAASGGDNSSNGGASPRRVRTAPPTVPISQRTTYGASYKAPSASALQAARGPQASSAPLAGHTFTPLDLAEARCRAVQRIHSAVQGSPARLRSSLGKLDGDRDGCISYGQLLTSLRRMGVELSTPELGSLLTTMDASGSGVVSIDCVAAVMRESSPAEPTVSAHSAHGEARGGVRYNSPPPATADWQPVVAMRRATWRSGCDTSNLRRLLQEVAAHTGHSRVSGVELGAALHLGGVNLPQDVTDQVVCLAAKGVQGGSATPEALLALLEASDAHTVGNANAPAPTSGLHAPSPQALAGVAEGNTAVLSRAQRRGSLEVHKMKQRARDAVMDVSVQAGRTGGARQPAHIRRLKRVFECGKTLGGAAAQGAPADRLSLAQLRYGLARIGVQFSSADFARFADTIGGSRDDTVSFQQLRGVLAGEPSPERPTAAGAPGSPTGGGSSATAAAGGALYVSGAQHTAPSTRSEHRLRERVGYSAPLHHAHRYFMEGAVQRQPPCTPLDAAAHAAVAAGYMLPEAEQPQTGPSAASASALGPPLRQSRRGGSRRLGGNSTPGLISGAGAGDHLPHRRSRRQVRPPVQDSTGRLGLIPGGGGGPSQRSTSAPRLGTGHSAEHIMSPGQREGDHAYGLRGFVTQGGRLTQDAQAARRHMGHRGWGGGGTAASRRSVSHGRGGRPQDSASSLAELARGGRSDSSAEGGDTSQSRGPSSPPGGRSARRHPSGVFLQKSHLGRDMAPKLASSDAQGVQGGVSSHVSLDGFATSGRGSWQARNARAREQWAHVQRYRASHWVGGVDLIGMGPQVRGWAAPRGGQGAVVGAPRAVEEGSTVAAPHSAAKHTQHDDVGESTRVLRPAVRPPLPPAW